MGGDIEIRPIRPDDVAGLAALFDGLDDEDRHRRFFSAHHPLVAELERMTQVDQRGGVALVAVIIDRSGRSRLVGEASYELLDNGDGELGITVSSACRGGLGSRLLDELLAQAAARGIPNLEADILAINTPMLAMARDHDAVSMATDDWSIVRMLIGSGTARPTWPGPRDRPRVLVEGVGGQTADPGVQHLACPGPRHLVHGCPALAGRPCALAGASDQIVVSVLDPVLAEQLRSAHQQHHPDVAVSVAGQRVPAAARVWEMTR